MAKFDIDPNPGPLGRVGTLVSTFQTYPYSKQKYPDHMRSKMVSDPGHLGRIGTGGLGGALASGAHSTGGQSQANMGEKVFRVFCGLFLQLFC